MLKLVERGCNVVVHYHNNRASAECVAQAARGLGVRAIIFGGDVADPNVARDLVETTIQSLGRIDILINNAGE